MIPEEKCFKTLDEQLDILASRGLIINKREEAKRFLLYNNYYRVSGYSLTLRNNDVFYKEATFQNIVDIYCFDQELRHILLKYIEKIEVSIKSIYAYYFTQKYGPTGHLNAENYTDKVKYSEIINKVEEQKNKNLKFEAYLKHFIEDLKQPIPLWAYIDLFTISDISKIYSISDIELKEVISREFGLNMKRGYEKLEGFLYCITVVRNLCAHGSRLFNRLFITKPNLHKNDKKLLRINKDGVLENDRLFGHLLLMKRLLSKNDSDNLFNDIISLCEKYSFVSMRYYGFPNDWKNNENIIKKTE